MSLLVDYCEYAAAKYACERWHYSECIPAVKNVRFCVWEAGDFIGAVVYSRSANPNIGNFLNLEQTQVAELTRVALGKHQHPVSQIVSYTIKMLNKKDNGLKALVSYADPYQNHHGGIYQAMNWIYVGQTEPTRTRVDESGETVHSRTVNRAKKKGFSTESEYSQLQTEIRPGKHKYVYPLDNDVRERAESMSEPYPDEP